MLNVRARAKSRIWGLGARARVWGLDLIQGMMTACVVNVRARARVGLGYG